MEFIGAINQVNNAKVRNYARGNASGRAAATRHLAICLRPLEECV